MNVVDSSAWLEYFAAGPNAGRFAVVIEAVEELLMPTIVLVEVTRRVMQQRGEDAALQAAALLHQGRVVPLDSGLALAAAKFGVDHKLPLADSIIFATAQQFNATLWTMDVDFEALPGVRYFAKRK
ncbi:MAG TPA: type II toxin-antitoxin system VapC family toxin [Gemmatimonadales bacterium]|nr:type II toxin-antitoxin system VapC family toxin [Gemmatimonadales bacterium]